MIQQNKKVQITPPSLKMQYVHHGKHGLSVSNILGHSISVQSNQPMLFTPQGS